MMNETAGGGRGEGRGGRGVEGGGGVLREEAVCDVPEWQSMELPASR